MRYYIYGYLLKGHESYYLHKDLSGELSKTVKKKPVKSNKHEDEIYDDDSDNEETENLTCGDNDGSDNGIMEVMLLNINRIILPYYNNDIFAIFLCISYFGNVFIS